jgi:putative Holliday junction resolvase
MMGLDIGEKRIGVAICDAEEILASPHSIIARETDETALVEIASLVDSYGIGKIVAGIPYGLDGRQTEQTLRTNSFITKLKVALGGIEIAVQDERLSTVEAQKRIKEQGKKKVRKKYMDDAVASIILQSYMDYHTTNNKDSG